MKSLSRVFRRGRHIAAKLGRHARLWRVPTAVRHVCGPRKPSVTAADLIVVSLVRAGEHHVEDFLTHHFKLGARHIVLLDNGSSDRTTEIAQEFDRVTVLKTQLPYKYLSMRSNATSLTGSAALAGALSRTSTNDFTTHLRTGCH